MEYDRGTVLDELRELAEVRLTGPVTVELVEWPLLGVETPPGGGG